MLDFNKDSNQSEDSRFPDLSPKAESAELGGVPVDPAPPVTPPSDESGQTAAIPSGSNTPEELLAEAKTLSSMPISSPEPSSGSQGLPDIEIPKTNTPNFLSVIFLLLGAIILVMVSGAGGYFVGKSQSQVTSLATSSPAVFEPTPTPLPSPTPTPPATVGIGDEVKLESGLTLMVEKVWLDSAYAKSKAALPDKVQVNVQVTFANEESNAFSYTPTDFRLKDSKGLEYKALLNASKEYKPLVLGSLLPSANVTGGISFVVPKTEKSFKLFYEGAENEFNISTT